MIEGISYLEFKERYSHYSRIVVVGPQRSGTRFSSQAIAKDFGIKFIDEFVYVKNHCFYTMYKRFLKCVMENDNFCIQAPALTHEAVNMLNDIEGVLIVYMVRDLSDILSSEKRVGHSGQNQRSFFEKRWSERPIAQLKYEFLDDLNSNNVNVVGVEYESMCVHSMWVDKSKRSNFGKRQIAPQPVNKQNETPPQSLNKPRHMTRKQWLRLKRMKKRKIK